MIPYGYSANLRIACCRNEHILVFKYIIFKNWRF